MRASVYNAAALALLSPCAVLAGFINARGHYVAKTVTLPNGNVIDWVHRESQGDVAELPPFQPGGHVSEHINKALAFAPEHQGPLGTVPVLRARSANGTTPSPNMQAPGTGGSDVSASSSATASCSCSCSASTSSSANSSSNPRDAGSLVPRAAEVKPKVDHFFVTTSEFVDVEGGATGTSGIFSIFNTFVATLNDFSSIGTRVARRNVPGIGDRAHLAEQAIQAGFIVFPRQDANHEKLDDKKSKPHLFTFFSVNGNTRNGDNLGGFNLEQKGFVQVDTTFFPGMELAPLSKVGGPIHELTVQYKLVKGNWWLNVNNNWVGYYPGSIFTFGGNKAADTLQSKADRIDWLGEVSHEGPKPSFTDMGSGRHARKGRGKAAHIRNIKITSAGTSHDYDGKSEQRVTNSKFYSLETHFKSGGSWGSFMFLGGPGQLLK